LIGKIEVLLQEEAQAISKSGIKRASWKHQTAVNGKIQNNCKWIVYSSHNDNPLSILTFWHLQSWGLWPIAVIWLFKFDELNKVYCF
jgi:hypothetical protein